MRVLDGLNWPTLGAKIFSYLDASKDRKVENMKMFFSIAILMFAPSIALADGPPSDSERASIVAAMTEAGCSGGHIEKDDGGFEVEDAICGGTPNFDLHLSASFEIVSKRQDD